ncbi:uncharacterized protein TM35_000012290 [Trypanosoma theileri]|uniref:Uncharacterized protein n=1 Tax=Trypanosoma theileri TaxID=67003 RepID=A0A1X0P8U5_9TRYP|nr:uncharacterized protein TM35_000012290 [Trypanosoma theileri]ORC93352.1 hypothetical protein TM35_000012290 [Trypanosoma theileri]
MSFRYTNNLVGALKHRLMLESSHRELVRRRFSGHCRGVEVVCSGYGTVLAVRLVDKAAWEPFYRKGNTILSGNEKDETAEKNKTGPLDFDKLAESIKTALWDATRKIRAAKEAALHRSLSHNQQLQSQAELKHWYEEDANTLEPLAFEALKHEAATPWMQLVQFGKRQSASTMLHQEFIKAENTSSKDDTSVVAAATTTKIESDDVFGKEDSPCVTALNTEDCDPAATPIGSVHPLFVPALIQIEDSTQESVDEDAIRREQWRELSRDEQLFWERVELIRKGQMATIKGGHKRDYADQAAVAHDNAEEKVQLRFTQ